jgi:hypothetical protein
MDQDAVKRDGWYGAAAAWLALTAPGALVTCAIVTLALLVVPTLTPLVVVPRGVQLGAAGLLLAHAGVTVLLDLRPGRTWEAVVFLSLLGLEALLCGMLLAGPQDGLTPLLACAILVMSLEVGGWLTAGLSVAASVLGALAATWWGISVALVMPVAASLPTTLAVETSFAGAAVIMAPPVAFSSAINVNAAPAAAPAATFSTQLSVETWMAGGPAFASPQELFVPALALVLVALCLGLATSTWRVRRARAAVAASIVAAARVTT